MQSIPHRNSVVIAGFFGLAAIATLAIGCVDIYRASLMCHTLVTATAHVTDTRIAPYRGWSREPSFQLQYEFRVPGRADTVRYTGQILIANRWVRVPEPVWDSVIRSQTVSIVYSRKDPRVNLPIALPKPTKANGVGLLLLGALVAAATLFWVWATRLSKKY